MRQEHPLAAVARRGFRAADTDCDGWERSDARWDEHTVSALLAQHPTLAACGVDRALLTGAYSAERVV